MTGSGASQIARLLAASVLFSLAACGGGDGGDGPDRAGGPQQTVVGSGNVGSAGGTVSVTDSSSPLFGTAVVVPADALATPTEVTISSLVAVPPAPGLQPSGPVAEFGPSGVEFRQPVAISLPATSSFSEEQSDLIYEYASGTWSPGSSDAGESHGQAIDRTSNTLTHSTRHFSPWARYRSADTEKIISNARGQFPGFVGFIPYIAGRCNCPSRGDPTKIIIHSTNDKPGMTFAQSVQYGVANRKPAFAHYYIDRDGTTVQVAPDSIEAPHTGGTLPDGSRINQRAVGIELFQPRNPSRPTQYSDYTETQLASLRVLTRDLMRRYNIKVENIHRHKEFAAGDPDHQDPYGWTDADWERFIAPLRPFDFVPVWKRMSLPYSIRATYINSSCLYVEGLTAAGIASYGHGGGGECGSFREYITNDLAKEGYRLYMYPTMTYFKLFPAQGSDFFLGFHGNVNIQQMTGSLRIDANTRRAEFVAQIDKLPVQCSSTTPTKNGRGTLSIRGESVWLVQAAGAEVLMGALPKASDQFPLTEEYYLLSHFVALDNRFSENPSWASISLGLASDPFHSIMFGAAGSAETTCNAY
jgi:hypothetical protein